jgi:multiple sugar transport system permease protein
LNKLTEIRVEKNKLTKLKFDSSVLFILPGLAGLVVFFIWPFIISIGYAFVSKPVNGEFVGFANFISLLQNKTYLLGLKNTLIFIGVSLPIGMLCSLGVALLINRVKKYRALFILIFLIPLVIPSGSMVFFWKSLFTENGFINGVLASLGADTVKWLETAANRFVLVLIFIWKNMGYNMILFLSGLSNVPKECYEAAAVDGAGKLRVFTHITAPNLIPTVVLVVIMSVINSFKVFKEVFMLSGNYPHESVYMLQHFMNNMFFSLNYQKLTTATCILVIIISLMAKFLFSFERRATS